MLDFDLFNPTEMTGYVRELQFTDFALVNWFPTQERAGIDYAFTVAQQRREEMASYRGFDVPAPIGDRPSLDRVRGAIPPMSKKLPLTEWERLNLAREQGNTQAAGEMVDLAYDDAAMLTESLQARLEYARGTAFQTAQITFVTDTGFTGVVIDYTQIAAITTVTASNLWSDYVNGDPVGDLTTWTQAWIIRNKGAKPGAFVLSTTGISHALRCAKFRGYQGGGAVIPTILTLQQANQLLAAFSIPPMVAYDAQVNVPGSGDVPVLPVNKGFLVPLPGDKVRFGETTIGVTAEALELVGKNYLTLATAPGLTAVGMTEFDPVQKWTKVSALAVPVLKDPRRITVATIA